MSNLVWKKHDWKTRHAGDVPSEYPWRACVKVEVCENCCVTRVLLLDERSKTVIWTHPQFHGAWKKRKSPKRCTRPRRSDEQETP